MSLISSSRTSTPGQAEEATQASISEPAPLLKRFGNAVANATSGTLDKFVQPRNLKK
ncbi:hypothetical protein O181_044154, partial [Austropuccinia psidii MF-1]|nr:hypothetical protein [Austropuccinia psidii MF-1]